MNAWRIVGCLLIFAFVTAPLAQKRKPAQKMTSGDPELAKKISRFAPTVLTANTASLSPKDRKALTKIIAAARLIDPLYLRQVWSGNDALLQKLEADK